MKDRNARDARIPGSAFGMLAVCSCMLAVIPSDLFADGVGTKEVPFSGDSVTAGMDSGAAARSSYYLLNTDKGFGPAQDVGVGLSTPNNNLTITGGAKLTGGGSASIGYSRPSVGNSVTVSGIGSAWRGSVPLTVGTFGAGNVLAVVNGGSVAFARVAVGGEKDADGNSVTVSGYGSSLGTASSLCVGVNGAGNSMEVYDSASVTSDSVVIGDAASSSGNGVNVSGSGSVMQITGVGSQQGGASCLYVGRQGSRNVLEVSEGASVVASGNVSIGLGGAPGEGAQNVLVVTDAGSVLDVSGSVRVGEAGSSNLLVIQNGALARIDGALTFNASAGASDNSLYLAGGFLALRGNVEDAVRQMLIAGDIRVWQASGDGSFSWAKAVPGDVLIRYCSDDGPGKYATTATDFSGYDGIGGYTLVSGGSAIAEQAGEAGASAQNEDSSAYAATSSSGDLSSNSGQSGSTVVYQSIDNNYYTSPYRGYYAPDGAYIYADSCWFGFSWYWNVLPGLAIYTSWGPANYGWSHWPRYRADYWRHRDFGWRPRVPVRQPRFKAPTPIRVGPQPPRVVSPPRNVPGNGPRVVTPPRNAPGDNPRVVSPQPRNVPGNGPRDVTPPRNAPGDNPRVGSGHNQTPSPPPNVKGADRDRGHDAPPGNLRAGDSDSDDNRDGSSSGGRNGGGNNGGGNSRGRIPTPR